MEDSPVRKLVYAVLLGALRKHATEIWIRMDGDHGRIDFQIDGDWRLEMEPPELLFLPICRLLGNLASLPYHGVGEYAHGTFRLRLGDGREPEFRVAMRGHARTTEVRVSVNASD